MLDLVYSIPNRRNKAFGRASKATPGMFSDSNGLSTLASATDGVMTRHDVINKKYWIGYLFKTSSDAANKTKLEIAIDPGTIRTILISSNEICVSPWNYP